MALKPKRWNWEFSNYESAIKADNINGGFRLATRIAPGGKKPRTPCPGCGRLTQNKALADLRNFPQTFIDQLPASVQLIGFACSGCWSKWERDGMDCGDGRAFDECILCEFGGAPQECVDEMRLICDNRRARFFRSAGAQNENLWYYTNDPAPLRRNLGGPNVPRAPAKKGATP